MTTWITSDLHYGHKNILQFCSDTRDYNDVDHMNEQMVQEWNALVQPADLTYILGDVAFCNAVDATNFLNKLNGKKILIQGNHDAKLVKHAIFNDCFEEIHLYHEMVFEKVKICMFHYPIFDHNASFYGSLMLHGHCHGKPHGIVGRIMDVGMDATGHIVVKLSDVVEKLINIPVKSNHLR